VIQRYPRNRFYAFPRIRFAIVLTLVFLATVFQNEVGTFDFSYLVYYCSATTVFQMLVWSVIKKLLSVTAGALRLEGTNSTLELILLILAEIACFHVSLISSALFFLLPGNSSGMSFSTYGPGGIAHIVNGRFTLEGLISAQGLLLDAYVTATLICLACLITILRSNKSNREARNG